MGHPSVATIAALAALTIHQSKFIQNGIVLNDNLSRKQQDRAGSRVRIGADLL
jgi:hypothetical protein